MQYINCPFCDEHYSETEFEYGGEYRRSVDTESCTDKEWIDYLFVRKNTKGLLEELWFHSHGCEQWFKVKRNTMTNQILSTSTFDQTERTDNT